MTTVAQVIAALETGQTLRFHTEARRMIKTQDVAQHVHGMLWLILLLTAYAPSRQLLVGTIHHDAGERWTGDMPSPAKRSIEGLGAKLDALEASRLKEQIGSLGVALSASDEAILKLADALDGCFTCDREVKLGNRSILKMYQNFQRYAEAALEDALDENAGFDDKLAKMIINYHQGVINDLIGK